MPLVLGLRYPVAGLRALRKPRIGLLEESQVCMRVRLSDCDVNLHVNNGRYRSLMDIGRIDHVTRAGGMQAFRANGWNPVAGGATIRFRRELRLGARYVLRTRCAGWDDGWWFFEQIFERGDGMLAARAYAKVAILGADGRRLDTGEVAAALGLDPQSPELPVGIVDWQRTDAG